MTASASGRSTRGPVRTPLRIDAAKLGVAHVSITFVIHDLETVCLHEGGHGLVHGLRPRGCDGDPANAEKCEGVDKGSRAVVAGLPEAVFHPFDQLAVVTLASVTEAPSPQK